MGTEMQGMFGHSALRISPHRTSYITPLWAGFPYSMFPQLEQCRCQKKVGVGKISLGAFRRHVVRYWHYWHRHPFGCRAIELGKPCQGSVIYCTQYTVVLQLVVVSYLNAAHISVATSSCERLTFIIKQYTGEQQGNGYRWLCGSTTNSCLQRGIPISLSDPRSN